jgi:Flp pilus assembly pilin Flp
MKRLKQFFDDRQAQDLIEYTLILAFVALASAGLMMGAGGSVSNIWGAANDALGGGVCPSGYAQEGVNDDGSPNCLSKLTPR